MFAEHLPPLTSQQIEERDDESLNLNLTKFTTINHYKSSSCFLQLKQCLPAQTCIYKQEMNIKYTANQALCFFTTTDGI